MMNLGHNLGQFSLDHGRQCLEDIVDRIMTSVTWVEG